MRTSSVVTGSTWSRRTVEAAIAASPEFRVWFDTVPEAILRLRTLAPAEVLRVSVELDMNAPQ